MFLWLPFLKRRSSIYYKIQVYDDGDVYVTETLNKEDWVTYLYRDTIDEMRKEFIDYDVQELEEDIKEIENAEINQEVRCY